MTDQAQKIDIAPGIALWPGALDMFAQASLVGEVLDLVSIAPFYTPRMPKSGKPFSVVETNFGSLGWFADESGYSYITRHPVTGRPWPGIPRSLVALWQALARYPAEPECCLVNRYGAGTRMGLHQDRDEQDLMAPVMSISLGDDAVFRFGENRKGPTRSLRLRSGDVLAFGPPARLMFHGVDRIIAGSSQMVPGGGRLNLTLRRVTTPKR